MPQTMDWKSKAAAKAASVLGQIPVEWRLSPEDLIKASKQRNLTGPFIESFIGPDHVEITKKDAVVLVDSIKSGRYSAKQVTLAFCNTAAIAHQMTSCLHEIFFEEAIKRAEELDEYFKKHKKTIGPLHGLPVSLKDQFHVKGYDTHMGFVGWIGTYEGSKDKKLVHKVNSQLVDDLLQLGAILYCKTSCPQTLLMVETHNNIVGSVPNPHNQLLSCGGSSGGEGALQALRGSVVGLGSDIGGSVRIPASACGTFSIKPSRDRLSYRQVANVVPGQLTYPSVIGPMATSLNALSFMFESLLSTQPWLRDPALVPIPWRTSIIEEHLARANQDGSATGSQAPIKFGIFCTDGYVTPHPPVQRGMKLVIDAIKNAGHKTVDWNPPDHHYGDKITNPLYYADSGHDVMRQIKLSGEPLVKDDGATSRKPLSAIEYEEAVVEGRAYQAAYSDYWNSTATEADKQIVDALIMPVSYFTALIPGKMSYLTYTTTVNILNYSAVCIPVTKADKTLDQADPNYKPLNDQDAYSWAQYDADVYDGAPVAIQIVCRSYEEEKAYAIANIVCDILKTAKIS